MNTHITICTSPIIIHARHNHLKPTLRSTESQLAQLVPYTTHTKQPPTQHDTTVARPSVNPGRKPSAIDGTWLVPPGARWPVLSGHPSPTELLKCHQYIPVHDGMQAKPIFCRSNNDLLQCLAYTPARHALIQQLAAQMHVQPPHTMFRSERPSELCTQTRAYVGANRSADGCMSAASTVTLYRSVAAAWKNGAALQSIKPQL